jgi:hypothetical protein
MTAFKTIYRCGNMELYLGSLGVAKPPKKLATQCHPKKFIKNLINGVDYATDSVCPSFQEFNGLMLLCALFNR